MKNKLKNFPKGYYISLEESLERQENIINQFSKYEVNLTPNISKRFSESDDIVTGKYLHFLNGGTIGTVVSHLKSIKHWYENFDDEYAFFCEDDLSLETVEYWDFTWEEFINNLPSDWEVIQLSTIRDNFEHFNLRERQWNDWSATAFILTRSYAKKLLDTYVKNDTYHLEIPNSTTMPLVENIFFTSLGKAYTIPLFVEDTQFQSTYSEEDDSDVKDGQKSNHYYASQIVLDYWKNKSNTGKYFDMDLQNLLTQFSLDTENPVHNFNLGIWYENNNHTAPALSYYLRCAERSQDLDLAYEALIRGSYCYEKQKTRDGTSKSLLQQALCLLPSRPEAYFLLSRFSERRQWWQDCYIYAEWGIQFADFESKPLLTDVEYPGYYGLLFEKAISGWWWGKSEESENILLDLKNNYPLTEIYKISVDDNLTRIGFNLNKKNENKLFSFDQNFDWGDLSQEDIFTIEREIVHEKVYRFWNDVKEGDVVVDVGASVGAFTVSILDQKPKKVYCIEPSKNLLKTLAKNCSEKVFNLDENPIAYLNYGIADEGEEQINIFGEDKNFIGITFKDLIKKYSIEHIDFLKVDCEGGEYSIFKDENLEFFKNNVNFIAIEIHLKYPECRDKFKYFRDNFLSHCGDYKVMSCTRQSISWGNSIDIKDRIFDDKFIDEYDCEFMIYINNT